MGKMEFTVVLADDEISILNGLKDAVDWEELGIQIVSMAQNGQEALSAIVEHNPDFAVIDIKMPELTGLEVIQKVRNIGLKTDFIILSGYDDFSYAKEAIHYGAKAYLLKPINSLELHDEIYRICLELSKEGNSNTKLMYQKKLNIDFFNRLIDSKILEPSIIQQILRNTEISLSDSSCFVCVFLYDQEYNNMPADDSIPYKKIINALKQEFVHEKCVFWKYNVNQIIGIFNTLNITSFQTAMKSLEIIKRNQFPSPIIGVGDTVPSLIDCSYSYNRALTATTYQLYDDSSKVFTYEVICSTPPDIKMSDVDYMPLIQYIVKKDLDGIKTYCNQFIDSLLYVPMPPPNYVFSLCYSLFHLIEQEFSSLSHQEIREISNTQDLYRFKRLTQIREWMIESFCQFSKFFDAVYGYATPKHTQLQRVMEETDDEIVQSAKEFIQNNIKNNIKIEDIANHVHLSTSYFAIYFKSKTGANLRDYILNEKMENARLALMKPNTSVLDVTYELGYGDYRSFSRAFKKVHGITPSDYQAKHK